VALHEHTSKSQREIADDVGVSQNAVGIIIRHFESTGSTATRRQGRCGRISKLTSREVTLLVRESKKNPKLTARQVKVAVGDVGRKVSLRTTQRLLVAEGRYVYRPIRAPKLDLLKRVSRKQWAIAHRNLGMDFWEKVISVISFTLLPFSSAPFCLFLIPFPYATPVNIPIYSLYFFHLFRSSSPMKQWLKLTAKDIDL
jgi:transposase